MRYTATRPTLAQDRPVRRRRGGDWLPGDYRDHIMLSTAHCSVAPICLNLTDPYSTPPGGSEAICFRPTASGDPGVLLIPTRLSINY